jgi:hypothetical protein
MMMQATPGTPCLIDLAMRRVVYHISLSYQVVAFASRAV